MDIDRRILVVDAPDGALQQLSLDLMGSQFGVHYATGMDEAKLLARDVHGKILAVLFSTETEIGRIPDIAKALGVETKSLIPVGERPAKRVIAALAFHGVRWHLWDNPPNESLRFVLSSLLYDHDPFELRYHLRIPTHLAAQIEVEGEKHATSIRDIGLGGACLFGGVIGGEDARADILFEVSDSEIRLPVRVAWSSGNDSPETNVTGVAFVEVEPEAGDAIDTLRRGFVERHRIEKPA
ncbi:MAG: PilZ domain-containing protein [Myxococcota bacterium]